MKRLAGLVLLLAGCAAPTGVAAPADAVAPLSSGTVQVRPESLLRLPGDDAGVGSAESVLARYRYLLPY